MTRSMPSVVLAGLFCLSATHAFAQDDYERLVKVLTLGDPKAETLARHRLTADSLRRMFAADRDLHRLERENPDVQRRSTEFAARIDPDRRLGEIEVSARVHEGIPEMAQILRAHNISGREYVITYSVAMVTAMTDDSMPDIPPELMSPALKFWKSMDPALKAEAAAWKKMRGYDKGLER